MQTNPDNLTSALLAAAVILIPLSAQILAACLRERLQVIERKIDQNTALTKMNREELLRRRAIHRGDDGPTNHDGPISMTPLGLPPTKETR